MNRKTAAKMWQATFPESTTSDTPSLTGRLWDFSLVITEETAFCAIERFADYAGKGAEYETLRGGLLCLDNPLSLALSDYLEGATVCIDGSFCESGRQGGKWSRGRIQIDGECGRHVLRVPRSYAAFDEAFCRLVYARRKGRTKASIAEVRRLTDSLRNLLPVAVTLHDVL